MRQWEVLEDYLTQAVVTGQQVFNQAALACDMGISGPRASWLIQSYLDAQRRPNSQTLYVLHRTGRTSNAVWHVGSRAQDARELGRQHLDDMRLRVVRAMEPDLIRMGILNPRAVQVSDAIVAAVEANLQLLAAGL